MTNYTKLKYEMTRKISDFVKKISQTLSKPQKKFLLEIVYGLLEGNSVHLSNIARCLKENITLKKTIERLSRNLYNFDKKEIVMKNYMAIIDEHIKENYAVVAIDNSEFAKRFSKKMEELSKIRDGSTKQITKGYPTIEAVVLAKENKMPLPIYEKVFSYTEEKFASQTHENLKCLKVLSNTLSSNCIRTLDRGFDANEYYNYFLEHNEYFIIRAKKSRNIIYNNEKQNIMNVAKNFKGNFVIKLTNERHVKKIYKISYAPIRLCEFPHEKLILIVAYDDTQEPMLLISNLKMDNPTNLCNLITKVYLLRWKIEEYFKFKKQQFAFEDIRVMHFNSIRNMHFLVTLATAFISLISTENQYHVFMIELKKAAQRIFSIPKFMLYALGYAFKNVLSKSYKSLINFILKKSPS